MPTAPDEQLMLAYAGGDAAAFDTLYARFKGPLFRLVLRSAKSRGEAEEIFQDIWIRVVDSRARYAPQAKFSTWLFTIAHNLLIDHWRRKGLQVVALDDDNDDEQAALQVSAGPGSEPPRIVEAAESLALLEAALAALPPPQREAFLLHHEGGLTVPEIAAATGTNEEAAKSRLRYAMDKLRKAVGDG